MKYYEAVPIRFFHSVFEVAGIDQAMRVSGSVETDSAPKLLLTEFSPQPIKE